MEMWHGIPIFLVALLVAGCSAGPPASQDVPTQSETGPAGPRAPPSVLFACPGGPAETPCPRDVTGVLGRARFPRVQYDPREIGRVVMPLVNDRAPTDAVPLPPAADEVRILVSDDGLAWQNVAGPEFPVPAADPTDLSPLANVKTGLSADFAPDGRLALAFDAYPGPSDFWMESLDLHNWTDPQALPGYDFVAATFLDQGQEWVSLRRYEDGILHRSGPDEPWSDPLAPAKGSAKCRDFGTPIRHGATMLAACAALRTTAGTVTFVDTSNIAIIELDPLANTYRILTEVGEPTCFNPMTLLPLPDGRFFVDVLCERDQGKPVLQYVPMSWVVDLANGTWIPVRGPLAVPRASRGGAASFTIDAAVDSQGVVHMLSFAEFDDAVEPRVRHATTLYTAYDPMTDVVLRSVILADLPGTVDEPTGTSILPWVYAYSGVYYARGDWPWDGSLDVQGRQGMVAWITDTGVSVQGLVLGP